MATDIRALGEQKHKCGAKKCRSKPTTVKVIQCLPPKVEEDTFWNNQTNNKGLLFFSQEKYTP